MIKRKRKVLPKNEEISRVRHTQTHGGLNEMFDVHRCLSQSEESKYVWTHGKVGITWGLWGKKSERHFASLKKPLTMRECTCKHCENGAADI